ncbi:CHAT domain-containing protein [Streptomyces sp. NBC_01233]|uniref:CHAT domain-containing protein n=1 Tax=Streptomyces sp. NBC_01233 TaxID=2903787 RepID=UPI002E15B5D3|nr:CHAT domain-containing protein [Streptomyces sp. NBC_01233]
MKDALLRELTDRIRDFGDGSAPDAVLDEAGARAAARLLTLAGLERGDPRTVDTDILHTVAAYHWARSLAHSDAALSAADHTRAMDVFGLLYLADHRRVPRALWSRLTEATGHDPWQDPVDHAGDLVLDVEEGGGPAVLDEAVALLQDAPAGPYRDTTLGLALRHRAADPARPAADRLADADAAVDLHARVAALAEESPARRARRRLTLAEAHDQRFVLCADRGDLAAAECAARAAFSEAPEGSAVRADAAASIGTYLGRRAEAGALPGDTGLLREAVAWLRLGVDLSAASGREPDRANLRRAMGLLLDRTAAPPEREPAEHGEGEGEGGAGEVAGAARPVASPDTVRQARDLAGLGSKVIARVLPEAEAVRRVVDPAFALSKEAVTSVVTGAARLVGSGAPQDAVPVLTLVLEAASTRWGTGPESPWWQAADVYVEAVRLSLVTRPDGLLFRRAHDTVRIQIDALRASPGADAKDELAETLFAAGLLHLSPYFGELPGLDFAGALALREERGKRHRSLHPDDPAHAAGPDMPSPADAADGAVAYLMDAAVLASGHELGRVLKALAEALSFLAGMRERSYDGEILLAARKAFDVLDPRRDPLGWLYVLRLLYRFGELALPAGLPGLLPVPLAAVRERQGDHEASCVFAEALTLAQEAHRVDLQARLLAAADRDLPRLSTDSQRRLRWSCEVHCLAGDHLHCAPEPMAVGPLADRVRSCAQAGGWPAGERAATLLHLAAHADPARDGEAGRALVDEARRLAPALVRRHADAVDHLEAVLAHDMGVQARAQQQPDAAARHFASAAFAFALCRQTDLALAALDAGLGCAHEAEGPAANGAAAALIPASVFLRQGPDETVDWKLRDLYQSLAFKMSGPTVNLSVMSGIHQAAKGMDFTISAGRPGALEFSRGLDGILERARRAEADLPGPLPDFDLPGGAETAMLYYLGSGEAEPDGDAEAEVRNLQRAADRWISGELRLARGSTWFPLLQVDEVQALLAPDTVLLSLFLGQVRHRSCANPVMALQGMAMTREETFHRTMAFPAYEGALFRMSKAGHTLNVSPAAPQVAGLREEITADPLHREAARTAARLLAEDSPSYLAGFADSLPSWLSRGKTHLCVWPNGPLHYLPFHLLRAGGRPLADDWTVTQVPSLSFLSRPAPPPSPHRGLAAFAFDSGGTDTLEAHTARIAASMGSAAPVLGAAATPRRFLEALSGARYVHVAAHGSHNEWAPWHQCLYLSPDPERGDDGRVFAHDVLRTDLRGVELVTMSACESALGRFDINDNLHGLPAAFLQAGAAAIVGCLWPVAPDVATAFFGTLYEQLALTRDRRTAFRTAQSTTRARHPAYRDWGAFCFIGDWRTTTDHPHGATE